MYNTDVAVFCNAISIIIIVNLIFVSCCDLANTNKMITRYNHWLGGSQVRQNFERNGLVTLTFDL